MKHRSFFLSRKWFFLLFTVLLFGCASREIVIEDHKKEFIARPLAELKAEVNRPDSYASKIGWKQTTYSLANGDYVYVEPVRQECFLHWVINPEGTIVGADIKGKGCEGMGGYETQRSPLKPPD
jgi:hypothetical protein